MSLDELIDKTLAKAGATVPVRLSAGPRDSALILTALLNSPAVRRRLATAHAPKGGVTLEGKPYEGGEFIPGHSQEEVDQAAAKQGGGTSEADNTKTTQPQGDPGQGEFKMRAEEDRFESFMQKFGGGDPEEIFRSISGAPDGAKVHVTEVGQNKFGSDYAKVRWMKDGAYADRTVMITPGGEKVLRNDLVKVPEGKQGGGTGLAMFDKQVQNAREHGFDRIECFAAKGKGYVGYLVWPKMGYDAPLPRAQKRKLPWKWKFGKNKVKTMQDLYTKHGKAGGPQWWEKNGEGIPMQFDLSDNSRSMQKLASYKEYKQNQKKAPESKQMSLQKELTNDGQYEEPNLSPDEEAIFDQIIADQSQQWMEENPDASIELSEEDEKTMEALNQQLIDERDPETDEEFDEIANILEEKYLELTGGAKKLATSHAPKGGVTLEGKPYEGGEFIPGHSQEEVDQAAAKQGGGGEEQPQRVLTKEHAPDPKKLFADNEETRKGWRHQKVGSMRRQQLLDAQPKIEDMDNFDISAVEFYTKGPYAEANAAMRKCPDTLDCVPDEIEQKLTTVQKLQGMTPRKYTNVKAKVRRLNEMAKQKLPERTTVYRGVRKHKLLFDKMLPALKEAMKSGEPITMSGFKSTTLDPNQAVKFATSIKGGVVFEIAAETGYYAEKLGFEHEKELVQSHETAYQVIGIEKKVPLPPIYESYTVVQMAEVPPGTKAKEARFSLLPDSEKTDEEMQIEEQDPERSEKFAQDLNHLYIGGVPLSEYKVKGEPEPEEAGEDES